MRRTRPFKRLSPKIISITAHQPRGSEWEITFFVAANNGITTYKAIVLNYDDGLTKNEAYRAFINTGAIKPQPASYECVCTMLKPWPYPEAILKKAD